jgi:AraC-like DNA-binding protein
MHTCLSALPCPALRQYVRAFAQREITSATPDIIQPVTACVETTLELDFKNAPIIEYLDGSTDTGCLATVVGPSTHRRASVRLRGPVEAFGVFFRPVAIWQLFGIPPRLLVNSAYPAEVILGGEISRLAEQMAQRTSFESRVRLMEDFLLHRTMNVFNHTEVFSGALHILRLQGMSSVAEIADYTGFGVRQFERRFLNEMGIAPKLFARIFRFQLALDSKLAVPGRSWLDIAHELGYYDQMHMIKEFRNLSGNSPGGILLELGDMRPTPLEAAAPQLIHVAGS